MDVRVSFQDSGHGPFSFVREVFGFSGQEKHAPIEDVVGSGDCNAELCELELVGWYKLCKTVDVGGEDQYVEVLGKRLSSEEYDVSGFEVE